MINTFKDCLESVARTARSRHKLEVGVPVNVYLTTFDEQIAMMYVCMYVYFINFVHANTVLQKLASYRVEHI